MGSPLSTPEQLAPGAVLDRSPLGAVRAAAASERKVLLTTPVPQQTTAWTKARRDVRHLLRSSGYQLLEVPAGGSAADWLRLHRGLRERLARNGHILIEYPFDQRKRLYGLLVLSRLLGVRLYGLIHDLDSLRFPNSPVEREIAILRLFDGLVSHNGTMSQWLRDNGVRRRMADLNLFDYLTDEPPATWREDDIARPLKVACAGNLSWGKARYVYDSRLAALRGVQLDLYGAFYESDRVPDTGLRFRGAFDPDRPVLHDRYHFGLVWDGTAVDQCAGSYGQYMRYNNPHKLSLYVALGLPVVVWREAAIADFVERCGIGVTVRDLRELGSIPDRVDAAAYRRMARNLVPLTEAVRRGDFLHDALVRLLR
ncbi:MULTISPECIES: hypothetical protein [Ramlibacter]|uniref:Galactofuranosyltransferase n=1 Tax=Ramlibacter pinisoli TaxID=2682844 RepID=A0A6N8IXZ4_9BURK|nr:MULTISPECIES: hypothetical protein [Ramlibacter]MBA2961522.1 hypothetical protein [Ramlibacter sp. CGMCC 1.13660]MVQ31465.1 hypothetical protein [Ramlibacter pinisoli]